MTTVDAIPNRRLPTNGRPPVGQMEFALGAALQRSLSLEARKPAAFSPAVLKPLRLLPRNMLLVGGDKSRQKSELDVLSRWDIAAEIATSGADALQFAAQAEFDLILIDAKKSVLDGIYVSSHLRHLERKRRQRPTVALVARVAADWPACEAVLRMAGGNDILPEVAEGAAVGECLRRWCSGCYRPATG